MSIDGCIDDNTGQRLLLSNEADFDRVDEVRAGCDAILVGAGTVRRDDPRLLVRSARRRESRVARGLAASPVKVTVTAGGGLDRGARFFAADGAGKVVYAASGAVAKVRAEVGGLAEVVDAGEPVDLANVLGDLAGRGIRRLMVEGGETVHTAFLTAGLADELHLVVAPFFVGDREAPRFVGEGRYPWDRERWARLVEARPIGDVVLLRYALSERCEG